MINRSHNGLVSQRMQQRSELQALYEELCRHIENNALRSDWVIAGLLRCIESCDGVQVAASRGSDQAFQKAHEIVADVRMARRREPAAEAALGRVLDLIEVARGAFEPNPFADAPSVDPDLKYEVHEDDEAQDDDMGREVEITNIRGGRHQKAIREFLKGRGDRASLNDVKSFLTSRGVSQSSAIDIIKRLLARRDGGVVETADGSQLVLRPNKRQSGNRL